MTPGGAVTAKPERSETDILDPKPIEMKVGRNEEHSIVINELVLRQYNKLFKIFSRILLRLLETSSSDMDLTNFRLDFNWKKWLPNIIGDAGQDIEELLMIALDKEANVVGEITGKQLPKVLAAIIEVNGLDQIIVGFQRLSATIGAEMMKRMTKDKAVGET